MSVLGGMAKHDDFQVYSGCIIKHIEMWHLIDYKCQQQTRSNLIWQHLGKLNNSYKIFINIGVKSDVLHSARLSQWCFA